MKRKNSINKMVSTKITQNDFDRIQDYASQRGLSHYEATRELLLYGLSIKEKENSDIMSVLEHLKEELEESIRTKTDKMIQLLESLPDVKSVESLENVIVQYLQQILYHGFRTDMWNLQYAKKAHQDRLAHELDQEVESLAKEHSA